MRTDNNPCLASAVTVDATARSRPRITRSDRSCGWCGTRVVAVAVSSLAFSVAGLAAAQNTNAKAPPAAGKDRTVVIKIVGPGGEPLTGVRSQGLTGLGSTTTTPTKTAEVIAPAPPRGQKRLVCFTHDGK